MSSFRASIVAICLAVLFAPVASAATFVVPPDERLIDEASAIFSGTLLQSYSRLTSQNEIETVHTFAVDEVFKGDVPEESVQLVEWGGQVDDRWMKVSGGPVYDLGSRYLVFLDRNREGHWTTQHLTLGRFEFRGSLLVRDRSQISGWDLAGNVAVEVDREATKFLQTVRDRVAMVRAQPALGFGDNQLLMPSSGHSLAPTFAGYNFEDASQVGAASWTDEGGSSVAYTISPTPATTNVKNVFDGEEKIIEEDPNGDIPGSFTGSGTVAVAFYGGTSAGITGSDVVTQDGLKSSSGFSQNELRTTMVHELGHTLGFRHSNKTPDDNSDCALPLPCSSSAIMNSFVIALNGVLQAWDVDAVRAVYGGVGDPDDYTTGRGRTSASVAFRLAELGCNPPTIPGAQPADKSVAVGVQTSLSVTPGGTGPFTYQWYFGTAPDTSNPVSPGGTSSSLTITPTSVGSGQYWVRVGHSCSGATANSRTATVTATCTNPSITAQSSSRTITGGQSTQLSVTATGSGLSYQWYRGTAPDTSTPVGNASTLTVSPSETTSYWVRVSGLCGSPVDSNTIVVTVIPCADTTVEQPTAAVAPGGPGKYTLSVVASSTATPLVYAWFKGGVPGFGGTAAGSGQSISVTVTTATLYWVRVTNSCGRISFSPGITVAACTLPTITTQPSDQSINFGQSATLSIVPGSGTTVKWYRGAVGDTTTEIGTGNSVATPTLTATTQFWAQVTNACGSISSRQVTVTVQQITDLVTLLNDRFFVIVNYVNQFENPPQTGKLLGRSLFETSTSETAIFTFGDPLVVELMVRVSDARPFENKIHVYLGGLSDVEFSVVIADSLTGIVNEYKKPPNQLVGVIDRVTFPATNSLGSAVDALMAETVTRGITPQAEVSTINLLNGRFQVRMRYRNQFENPAQTGYLNARSIATSPTTETAVFFFGENVGSVEWMVRFSDARPFAQRIDLFHGGLSDVEFTIEVLDTKTGAFKEYQKPPFSLNGLVDRDSYKP